MDLQKDWTKDWEDVEDKTNDKSLLTESERDEYAKNLAFEKLIDNDEIELATMLYNKEEN